MKKLLFVVDPLDQFKVYKDTTFSIMREAQRRGYLIAACLPQDIQWKSGGFVMATVQQISLTGSQPCWRRFKIEPPCRLNFEPGLLANR